MSNFAELAEQEAAGFILRWRGRQEGPYPASVVEARLAACAQVAGPVASMYWWDGGLERAEEWLVLLKLPVDRYDELAAFLTERHSYDEPEIIALPIVTGSAAYLTWMREETRRAEGASG